jgi:hypothetical protein
LALFPTLLGQALEALLGLHLLRRFGHLDGARDAAAATFFLFAAQAVYTGSLFNVAAVVLVLSAIQWAHGERRRTLRLLGSYAVAAAAVALLFYARFLPTFFREVLPRLRSAGAAGDGDAVAAPLQRLWIFYGVGLPLLALLGLLLTKGAPKHARRYALAALLAGLGLLGLRFALPTLFRDAKEVELLAFPIASLSAFALDRLWQRGIVGRLLAGAALVLVLLFCVHNDVSFYAGRFVAIDR